MERVKLSSVGRNGLLNELVLGGQLDNLLCVDKYVQEWCFDKRLYIII